MIRRPPRSTPSNSSAASDVYKRQVRTTVNGIEDSVADHVKEAEASDDLTILLIQYEPGQQTIKHISLWKEK